MLPARRTALALLSIAIATTALAARPRHAAKWTIDDIIEAEHAEDWTIDRAGRRAAWIIRTTGDDEGEETTVANLWASGLRPGDEPVQLTRRADVAASPRFSPDGRTLAFLFDRELLPKADSDSSSDDRDTMPQVWAIALAGGEPYPVTELDRPVEGFDWIDDDTILVYAKESPSAWEKERHDKDEDRSIVVDDDVHTPPVRLFRVSLDGTTKRLTHNRDWIDSLAVSPDGKRAIVTAQQSLTYEFDSKIPPRTFLVDLATGNRAPLFDHDNLLPTDFKWSPDGRGFYFIDSYSTDSRYRQAVVKRLYYHDLTSGSTVEVTADWPKGIADEGDYWPVSDGIVVLLADGAHMHPARYARSAKGWTRRDIEGSDAHNLDVLVPTTDGTKVVYVTSSVTRPDAVLVATLSGAKMTGERPLTDLNPGFEGKPTGRSEVVHWKGARGEEVEGILQYPLEWREGTRYPLVVDIHGGPLGVDRDTWSQHWAAPNILWRQRGAFVFQVNYHGSSDYGLEWAESIARHYYELEIPDIETGVDSLVARGLVDPGRLAVMGWSNGGILTVALITHSTRFKAASVGAADVEWLSDWANVDFGASFDNYYFGDTPWKDPQTYIAKSPFFHLDDVTTPTIVHTPTADRNVPAHEGWELFRALQWIDKAPVRFDLYPDEPHTMEKIAHRRHKIEEDLAWFDRYLFDTAKPKNEAVRPDSLIAGRLARARAARQGSAFGVSHDGLLIPETVPFEGLEIGRFEVTRAQWAAFDGSPVAPGEENLPATGMSFDRAEAYVSWLREKTGRPFRLLTRVEADRIDEGVKPNGNTLDHWAGYTPNPDDVSALAKAIASLGDGALLLPVGQFAGTGDDPVFDLDGNAAEWVVDDGRGVPFGPSADRSTDPRSTARPSPAYTGLRVAVGQ